MKIYSIVFNQCDLDQYDGFVVVAKDEKDVHKVLQENYGSNITADNWRNGFVIKEVKNTRRRVVLESFRPG